MLPGLGQGHSWGWVRHRSVCHRRGRRWSCRCCRCCTLSLTCCSIVSLCRCCSFAAAQSLWVPACEGARLTLHGHSYMPPPGPFAACKQCFWLVLARVVCCCLSLNTCVMLLASQCFWLVLARCIVFNTCVILLGRLSSTCARAKSRLAGPGWMATCACCSAASNSMTVAASSTQNTSSPNQLL